MRKARSSREGNLESCQRGVCVGVERDESALEGGVRQMTYSELFRQGKEDLQSAGIAEAQLDARLLLEYACGISRSALLAHGDRMAEAKEQAAYEELIARRKRRIPLQQLTGAQEFMGLEFMVKEQVLIPRQDTEILAEEVLKNLHDGMRILDMCTGSGCILISLLHYSNDCEGVGADISEQALDVARENARKLLEGQSHGAGGRACDVAGPVANAVSCETAGTVIGPKDRRGKISFVCSNLFEKVTGKFDIIVSNPPYISSAVIDTLMPEVREHEPRLALDGGEDGLFYYRGILEECGEYLFRGGKLFFEIGYDQAEAVRELMEHSGFLEINVIKDYAGLDRVVYGTLGFDTRGQ